MSIRFDTKELNTNRLLVFLENVDNGTFRQVILTREQFKKVSDAIVREVAEDEGDLKPGFMRVGIELSEHEIHADTFIGCSQIEEQHD